MKSLKTKEIDGVKIITGFQERPINPIESKEKSVDLIKNLPEIAEIKAVSDKRAGLMEFGFLERKKALAFRRIKNNAQADIHSEKCKKWFGAADLCDDEIREINSRMVPKQKEILRNNTVYFEARDGEVILPGVEIDKLQKKFLSKTNNQQIKIDGSIIDDFRGVSYNKKTSGSWNKITINKLGVKIPTGGKLDSALTDTDKTEIEAGRVDGLSVEEKLAEKEKAINSIMEKTIKMRVELEIKSKPDALILSQKFYGSEVAKIENKYK